jgi:hypothetical protein
MSFASIQRKIDELTALMQKAAADEDFETAARLRNEIAALKGEGEGGSPLVRQPPPGEMGLGTHVPRAAPPRNWRRPKKPDPMTRNVKPRGGR